MRVTELETDAGAILGHLTIAQRQRLRELDAAYIELLSLDSVPAKADVEALADAVVTFYDGLATPGVGYENGG
ncbi:hypothetical protein G6M78_13510 [Agrobacterium tumefaciens]|uniref:hypothetical protein n=1 Tax=Agrobacterium tumefaciens TaxID=358 RepID=UPI0015732904|nr:hypothetical protein [Agrobacterium tumefaciens]NTE56089.1 hypothetical protein [Agrobacterium tumefaciens]NTE74201.1 hypothetical protein [Agrobacterium tumefaciens]